VSFADGLPRGRLIERGFNLWSGAHGKSRGFAAIGLRRTKAEAKKHYCTRRARPERAGWRIAEA
jgi:hypothetical protein